MDIPTRSQASNSSPFRKPGTIIYISYDKESVTKTNSQSSKGHGGVKKLRYTSEDDDDDDNISLKDIFDGINVYEVVLL